MKKLFISLLAICLLSGCSHSQKTSTFMITKDNNLYALYNQDGKQLTEYLYKTFEEVKNVGYIVTDSQNQKGLISLDGKEIIKPGTYETLENVSQMFYATKKVENKESKDNTKTESKNDDKKTDSKEDSKKTESKNSDKKTEEAVAQTKIQENVFLKENMYVLNNKGEVLYSASDKTQIMKSGLPVIKEGEVYIVLHDNGDEFYRDTKIVQYAYQSLNEQEAIIVGKDSSELYAFDKNDKKKNEKVSIKDKGHFSFLASNEQCAILSDAQSQKVLYVDLKANKYEIHNILAESAQIDSMNQITLKNANQTYVYTPGNEPVLMTSYYYSANTYVLRSSVIYGPHDVFKDGKKVGEIENGQLYPVATQIKSQIFPVYVRDKGYQYYSFDNKRVINKTFLSAEPFDENTRAIVQEKQNQYVLIDETGKKITEKSYAQIKYIGSSYYAVYNKSGIYGIVDTDGKEVFPVEYTTLPINPIVTYNGSDYLVLGKNGRTYIYDIKDDMNEIFSKEGNVTFSEKGYFMVNNTYYTFEGELIK